MKTANALALERIDVIDFVALARFSSQPCCKSIHFTNSRMIGPRWSRPLLCRVSLCDKGVDDVRVRLSPRRIRCGSRRFVSLVPFAPVLSAAFLVFGIPTLECAGIVGAPIYVRRNHAGSALERQSIPRCAANVKLRERLLFLAGSAPLQPALGSSNGFFSPRQDARTARLCFAVPAHCSDTLPTARRTDALARSGFVKAIQRLLNSADRTALCHAPVLQ